MSGTPVIVTESLHKSYGKNPAVAGLDLQVTAGQIFGFLGPNGAGKSTTIGILCTLLRPDAGSAEVAGYDVVRQPDEVRRQIGVVFQESTLDRDLTAEQNLRFQANLFGLPRARARRAIAAALDLVNLTERKDSVLAIREQFGLEATEGPGGVQLRVPEGARFVPKLCAGLTVPVHSVTVVPPSLDDVFLHYTGRTIREADEGPSLLSELGMR
ncbi:MAG TPA: ATP-binding cassette domain-containing protein [Trebonia sp.]